MKRETHLCLARKNSTIKGRWEWKFSFQFFFPSSFLFSVDVLHRIISIGHVPLWLFKRATESNLVDEWDYPYTLKVRIQFSLTVILCNLVIYFYICLFYYICFDNLLLLKGAMIFTLFIMLLRKTLIWVGISGCLTSYIYSLEYFVTL